MITNHENSNKDYIVKWITEHAVPIKILIEVLKEILVEPIFKFIKENDTENTLDTEEGDKKTGGLRILSFDQSQTIMIYVKLEAAQFSVFECKLPEYKVQISLSNLYKLIRSLDKDEILSMYIENDDRQNLIIEIDNHEKGCKSINKLKLLELNEERYNLPSFHPDVNIRMDSSEFHRICKEMNQIAEYIEIRCTENKFTFSCKGDCSEKNISYDATNNDNIVIKFNTNRTNDTKLVQGIFELKNIVLFSKCSGLCNKIQISLSNDYPMFITYTIATLGKIVLGFSPIEQSNVNDYDYESETE
jgi:proliferating cell nuclear antigen